MIFLKFLADFRILATSPNPTNLLNAIYSYFSRTNGDLSNSANF
nr:MAG TPA: hypothetical protein [Caudoviricetes sp.]